MVNEQNRNLQKIFNLNSMAQTKSEERSQNESAQIDDKNATADIFLKGYAKKQSQQQNNECSKKIKKLLQSMQFQIFITIISLFSLFSDDMRTALTDSSADFGFDIAHIFLICIFSIQIVLNWISMEEYRWSFFFVLDVISSLSIFLDISMLTQLIYASNTSTYNLNKLAAQARASRVATRAVRIVKLVRIIRIVKMYKAAMHATQLKQQMKKKKMEQTKKRHGLKAQPISDKKSTYGHKTDKNDAGNRQITGAELVHENQEEVPQIKQDKQDFIFDADLLEKMSQQESKISKVLSDLTVKKVIIVVLLLMFLVPLFDTENYVQKAQSWDYFVIKIHKLLYKVNQIPLDTLNELIQNTILDHQGQFYLIFFSTPFKELPLYVHDRYGKQRVQDTTQSMQQIDVDKILRTRTSLTLRTDLTQDTNNEIVAVMNYTKYTSLGAAFSIGRTIFICIVLIGMLHYFAEDINELIVYPIERMMKQVMDMAKNPESVSMNLIDNSQYETAIVHNAIVKIGALLSLVFGSAGAQIIGSNIMQEGDMNPMIGGKKKCAIFGFCDIRNFTEVTELLQEDIMLFVNKIGELIHSSVYRYGGSANKNIGEAFLMVWPLANDSYKLNSQSNQIAWKKQKYVRIMSDFSVISFIKAIVKIHKDPAILQYKNDKRLLSGLGTDYQVKMGFGLHIGWAIQGAIGSEYKIDASYLSPNVNMASRLQAATKQYGVNILISQNLYEMLTAELKNYCRYIDKVTVKGSAKPIKLYTIDLRLDNISPPMDKHLKYKNLDDMLDVEIKKQLNMEYLEDDKIDTYNADQFIKKKKQLREVMVDATSDDFKKRFSTGLEAYLAGKWPDAKMHFNEAIKYNKNDGPTKTLLNYMRKYDYEPPNNWSNFRPLTEK